MQLVTKIMPSEFNFQEVCRQICRHQIPYSYLISSQFNFAIIAIEKMIAKSISSTSKKHRKIKYFSQKFKIDQS